MNVKTYGQGRYLTFTLDLHQWSLDATISPRRLLGQGHDPDSVTPPADTNTYCDALICGGFQLTTTE